MKKTQNPVSGTPSINESINHIAVDGRTDEEKLIELLHAGECTEVEYKSTLNLSDKTDQLNFIKDIVSMQNHYPGGYLLIGVNDDGLLAENSDSFDWALFDQAKISDKIRTM